MAPPLSFVLNFFYSQFFVTPTYPTKDHTGETIIVTGANVGLGLEAARHLVRLNASTVILAVRNTEKGEAAASSIAKSTGRNDVVQVWALDLCSYDSVQAFAKRAQGLKRLDGVIENAGLATPNFRIAEQDETTITTNVVSTFLLALLLLPKMRETATKFNVLPRLAIVSSEVHWFTDFPERKAERIFETLSDEGKANMMDRYNLSKLLEVFYVRELAKNTTASKKPDVVINLINPGLCHSELSRDAGIGLEIMKFFMARTTEKGSRTLVNGVDRGEESHGQFLSDCQVVDVAPLVKGEEGPQLQKRIWDELNAKLEKIQPGITSNV